jgi:hypothetical protein
MLAYSRSAVYAIVVIVRMAARFLPVAILAAENKSVMWAFVVNGAFNFQLFRFAWFDGAVTVPQHGFP